MQRLVPDRIDDVDVAQCYLDDRREPIDGRPWVVVNMATTIDGATALEGRSGGIGGPNDHLAFHALRSAADVVLAGAGTIRAENYGPVRVPDSHVAVRAAAGRPAPAVLASVSRSVAFEPDARIFSDPTQRPLLFTVTDAPAARIAALEPVADIVAVGSGDVDLPSVFAELGRRGVRCVVCEGGPALNGQLIAWDLVDEWCTTIGPILASGSSSRAAHGPGVAAPRGFRLDRLLYDGRDLLARYVADRSATA
ncbi:MAG: dihydrofolate reductase family protein [Actinobacteria bacterium]|nr:dihydrofolate reductase family protein [Actinomycetota bacterium]